MHLEQTLSNVVCEKAPWHSILQASKAENGKNQAVQRARKEGRPVEEARRGKWTRQLMAELGKLHQHFIIHRDIKPANIVLAATTMPC